MTIIITGPYHGDYINDTRPTAGYTSGTAGPNYGNRKCYRNIPSPSLFSHLFLLDVYVLTYLCVSGGDSLGMYDSQLASFEDRVTVAPNYSIGLLF